MPKLKKKINKADSEYSHHLLKEIFEQPQTVKNIIEEYVNVNKKQVVFNDPDQKLTRLKNINRIIIIGCGTSYHSGLAGKYMFSKYAGFEAELEFADEFISRKARTDSKTLVIASSQSGETADVVKAVRFAKKQKSFVISFTNVPESTLDKLDDFTLYCQAGKEKSLAATKTYSAQIVLFALLAVFYGQITKKVLLSDRIKILTELNRLPQKINKILKQQVDWQILANRNFKLANLLVMGGGYQYALALEAALKLKETTYMHAEGFAVGEFAHGPLALADKKHPCFIMSLKDDSYQQARELIEKLKKLRIKTIALGNEGDKQLAKITDRTLYIPKTIDVFNPLLGIIPIQILAYHIALLKGINPDKPRHLRKYVK